MYSSHNEGKSVVAERFIRTLKNKIYKHMTVTSKNVYFDVLDDIVDKYNNSNQMKQMDFGDDSFDPKFKIGDHVRISKYKNIFDKGYNPNRSEEVFVIKENKNYSTLDVRN